MNLAIYRAINLALAAGELLALAVALISMIAMIVRWRSPKRRGHVIRLCLSLAVAASIIAVQQSVTWLMFYPALSRQQMAEINASRAAQLAESSYVHVGDLAPQFSLTDADGNTFSLDDARGKVVLINFFATWCRPCQLELPHIEQLWQRYRNNENFRVLVIGREESMDSVREFRSSKGLTFPIAPDTERQVYELFAEKYIPRSLVIFPAGEVVYSQIGFYEADAEELEQTVSEQLVSLP